MGKERVAELNDRFGDWYYVISDEVYKKIAIGRDELIERHDPMGRPYYWIGGEPRTGDAYEVGTDIWAVANGYISVTPIRLDMTARNFMPELEKWQLFNSG